jgi:outer membrane protein
VKPFHGGATASICCAFATWAGIAGAQGIDVSSEGDSGAVPAPAPSAEWRWRVGLGVGAIPDYEGSEDYDIVPVPFVRGQKGAYYGQLYGLHLTSNLLNSPNWRLGPSLNYRRGYDNVKNNDVDRLQDREASVELGIKGGYDAIVGASLIRLSVEVLGDVSGGHNGYLIDPRISYSTPIVPRLSGTLGGGLTYASNGYMNHYFQVDRDEERRTGLRKSSVNGGVKDFDLTGRLDYEITPNWSVGGQLTYKLMVGDAAESSVVDEAGEENQFIAILGFAYSW